MGMRYLGDEKSEVIVRYVEYLRCDNCNKKININEQFYEVSKTNDDEYNYNYYESQICNNCIKSYLNNINFNEYSDISICKEKLYKHPFDVRNRSKYYCLVKDDKGENL